jgi:hypothetical protein
MASQNGLIRRVAALEAAVPGTACRTCARRPAIVVNGDSSPCAECGTAPRVFTIEIDAPSGRDGDAARRRRA